MLKKIKIFRILAGFADYMGNVTKYANIFKGRIRL